MLKTIRKRTLVKTELNLSPRFRQQRSAMLCALGPACAHGESQNWAVTCGWKWMGASWLERAEPHGSSPTVLFHCTLDLLLGGPRGTGRGACTWWLDTRPPIGSRKWVGATQQEHAEPHGQFTGLDDFIASCYLNREPMWTQSRPPAHRNPTGFGVAGSSIHNKQFVHMGSGPMGIDLWGNVSTHRTL